MKACRAMIPLAILVMANLLWCNPALADKSSVTIQAPSEATKGSEVIIVVTTKHSANSFLHYTEWVSVMVNGKEVERWKYTASNRPPGEVFTKEVKVPATGDLNIKAEASCNVHGSAGPATLKVAVKN
jgi:desulfoferrodoxin (superoxide reductase-like protein)